MVVNNVIKAGMTAAATVFLLTSAASASAPMSADSTNREVSIYVKGRGLHVERISAISGHHRNGEKFRIWSRKGSTYKLVKGWKLANFETAGGHKFASAVWKTDRKFRDGTWLCAEATKSSGEPCIKIHR